MENDEEDRGNVMVVIQGYLDYIVKCAKNKAAEVRENAAEVLKLIFLQGQVNASKLVSIFFCMLGDENIIVRESAFFCIEKSFSKNPDFISINLGNSLKESFDYQKKVVIKRNLNDSFYPKLYSLIRSKKTLRIKFLNSILALLEPSNPSFTEYICEILSCFLYTNLEEISLILNFLTGKIQTSAFRLLRAIKVTSANKDPLTKEKINECLVQVQMILLKNYFFNAYGVKAADENADKEIQKNEEIGNFGEDYEEFKDFHCINEVNNEELKKFKKKVKIIQFKNCIISQNLDEIPTKKRVKKIFDSEQFVKQNLNL